MEIKGKTSLGIKFFLIILTPIILYGQDLIILMNEALNSDIASYILAIPFLLTYIVYQNRKTIAASSSQWFTTSIPSRYLPIKEIMGTLICLLAYLIKWFGSYTFKPLEYHIASLPLFVLGLILIAFNAQTLRTLLFPILFLVFLIPPPVEIIYYVGAILSMISSQVAYSILNTMGLPVSLSNMYNNPVILLNLPSGAEIPFAIDIACSGIYSLMGFIIFTVFIAYIARGPLLNKLAILSIGLPLIYALNILRIVLIVLIGHFSGPTLALNMFHLFGGWVLILTGTIILLILVEKILKIHIFGTTSDTCTHLDKNTDESLCMNCGKILKPEQNSFSKRDAIKVTLFLAISISLVYIQVPVFALTEAAAEVFIQKPSGEPITSKILPQIEGYETRFIYRDVEFEKISGQNASLLFQYLPINKSKPTVWVGLEIASVLKCLHPWELCLVTYLQDKGMEPLVKQLDVRDIHLLENPPLPARYFAFKEKDSNLTQVILYWYTRSIFKTGEDFQKKWIKISVIEYTNHPEEHKKLEEELLPIATTIANYWQPITRWSWAALTIAKNGPKLIMITGALLIGTLIISLYQDRNRRRGIKHAFTHLYEPVDLYIIDAIKALTKEVAIEYKIASKYKELSGNEIDMEELKKKLNEAEEFGLIQRKLISINNKPYITWKLTFKN